MVDRLLTAQAVADRLGIKPKTVLAWAGTGYLHGLHLGPGNRRLVRFRESEIMALIEGQGSGITTARKRGGALDCQSRGRDYGLLSVQEGTGK